MPTSLVIMAAVGATIFGSIFVWFGYLGRKWARTKSESWIATVSSTDGAVGSDLTAARTYRDMINHPRCHTIIGWVAVCIAVLLGLLALAIGFGQ